MPALSDTLPFVERIVFDWLGKTVDPGLGFTPLIDDAGLGFRFAPGPTLPAVRLEDLSVSGGLSARLAIDGLDAGHLLEAQLFGGFKVALSRFAVAITDGRLASVDIAGLLTLPFFTDGGNPVTVAIEVALRDDGSLGVVLAPDPARATPDGLIRIHCGIGGGASLTLFLASLEVDEADGVFRLALSGRLEVDIAGLQWPGFELRGLVIDSRGHVSIGGGWLELPSHTALDFFGFHVDLKKIGFGSDQDGRWIGFDGDIHLVEGLALGGSVRGMRISLDASGFPLSFDGVTIDFTIPGAIHFFGEVDHVRASNPSDLHSITLPAADLSQPADVFFGKVRCEIIAVPGLEIDADFAVGHMRGASVFFLALDAELPAGIPVFLDVSLFGVHGLFASNLRPDPDHAANGPHSFWEWYKYPSDGQAIMVDQPPDLLHGYTGTDVNKWIGWPQPGAFALGCGATLGTSADNGYVASAAVTLVLMLPGPVIQLIGKANILSKRISGRTAEATFDAFACYDGRPGRNTFDLAIHAHYGIPLILDIESEGDLHAGPDGWYFALGLPPQDKRVRARVLDLFETDAYFVISDKGLITGTWTGYRKSWDFGPLSVGLNAYIASLLAIQFIPAQISGGMEWHGEAHISAFGIGLGINIGALVEGTAPHPFWIHGEFQVSLDLPWPLPDVGATISLSWGDQNDTSIPPAPLALSRAEAMVADHRGVTDRWTLLAHVAGQPLPLGDKGQAYDDPQHPGLLTQAHPARTVPGGAPATVAEFAALVPQDAHFVLTFTQPVRDLAGGPAGFPGATTDENLLHSDYTAVSLPSSLPADPMSNLNPNPPAVTWTYRHSLLEVALLLWDGATWRTVAASPKPTVPGALDLPGIWLDQKFGSPSSPPNTKPNTLLKLVPYQIWPGDQHSADWGGPPRTFSQHFSDQGLQFDLDPTLAPADIVPNVQTGLLRITRPVMRFTNAVSGDRFRVTIMFAAPMQILTITSAVVTGSMEFPDASPPGWLGDGRPIAFTSTTRRPDGLFDQSTEKDGVSNAPLISQLSLDISLRGTYLAALRWKEPDIKMAILPRTGAVYALKITTAVDAAPVGSNVNWQPALAGLDRLVEFAYVQTACGPGTAGLDGAPIPHPPLPGVPVLPPLPALAKEAAARPALGPSPNSTFPAGGRLIDLSTYAQWTLPADGDGFAYPAYDLTVEFNETYVNALYAPLGFGNPQLALHLRCVDRNHRHLGIETISNNVPTARAQAAVVGNAVALPPPLVIELGWLSLKFKADGAMVGVLGAGGRIELLARGHDGAVWHITEAPLPDWGGTRRSLGGVIQPLLAGIANPDGRVEIFAKGMDNAVWHNWQTTPGGAWSGWTTLGGAVDDLLVAASEGSGRLVVFARRRDGSLWHIKQTPALDWGQQWLQFDGTIQDALAVGTNADGRLEVFAKRMDGALYHRSQLVPGGTWSPWFSLGGTVGDLVTVARQQNGLLDVFVRAQDGSVQHIVQTAAPDWGRAWKPLNGVVQGALMAVANADGRLELFARGMDDNVWHTWQVVPNGAWSGWDHFGSRPGGLMALARNADGRFELFATDAAGEIGHVFQVLPSNGWNIVNDPAQLDAADKARALWPGPLDPATHYTVDVVPYALRGRVAFFSAIAQQDTAVNTLKAIKAWHAFEDSLPSLLRFQFVTSRYRTFTDHMANAVRQTQTGSLRRYVTTLSLPEWLTANPALAQAITRASSDYNAARVALAGLLAAFDPLADDLARGGVDPKTVGDAGLVARRADAIAAWQNLSQAVADAYDALAAMIGRPDLMADGRAPPPDLEVSLLAGASGFAEALFVDSPEPLPWPRLWEGVHLKRAGFASRLVGTTVLWSRDGTRAFVLPSRGVRGTYQPEFRFSGTPGPELPAITRGDTPVVEVVQLGLVRLGAA